MADNTMDSLEQRLRQQREETRSSLGTEHRRVFEEGGALGGADAELVARKLDDGVWQALFEIAREIEQLKD